MSKFNLNNLYMNFYYHVIIKFVNLLRVKHLVQQLVGVPPFSGKNDSVIGQNSCKIGVMSQCYIHPIVTVN